MISHSERFVFVHIPKTGGTSVSRALRQYGIATQGPVNYESLYFKHATARDIKRMLGQEFDRYRTFAIVRNPWDWAVSNYEFNRGLHRPWTRGTSFSVSACVPEWASSWDFKHWLEWWCTTLAPQQSHMLIDSDGALLVHRLLKYESLERDFAALLQELGLGPRPLPHEMQSKARRPYWEYYDQETSSLIIKYFRKDVETFGYPELLGDFK